MAIVVDDVDHMTPLGIVTLEAIIEELIQRDMDETDKNLKLQKSRKKRDSLESLLILIVMERRRRRCRQK